jgi:hypothetical protein
MTKQEQATHISQQLEAGLDAAYEAMLAFKRYKQTPVVIVRDGKVVYVTPEDMPALDQKAA